MKALSEREFISHQQAGKLPSDLSYQEYMELEQKQLEIIAARRAAMNPLDREILEFHEARHRREAEARQQETERRAA